MWHPVRNEGRLPCDGPTHEDDFLETIKAAREERQLKKIRVKVKEWEQSEHHGVAPRIRNEGRVPCDGPSHEEVSWREPRKLERRDS